MESNENMNSQVTLVFDQKAKDEMATIVEEGGGSGGSSVIANPTLSGDEAALTGLQVDDVKYKVASEISVATDSTLGGIKTNGSGSEPFMSLGVQVDSNGGAYVDTSTLDTNAASLGLNGFNVNIGSLGEADNSWIYIGKSAGNQYTNTLISGDVNIGSADGNVPSTIHIGEDLGEGEATRTTTSFSGNVNFSGANVTGLSISAENGLPEGGVYGDVLIKNSATNYDAFWESSCVNSVYIDEDELYVSHTNGASERYALPPGYQILNMSAPLTSFIPLIQNAVQLADVNPGTSVGFNGCNIQAALTLLEFMRDYTGTQAGLAVVADTGGIVMIFVTQSFALHIENTYSSVVKLTSVYSPHNSTDSYDFELIIKGTGEFKLYCTKNISTTSLPNQDPKMEDVIADITSALEAVPYNDMEQHCQQGEQFTVTGTYGEYQAEGFDDPKVSILANSSSFNIRWNFIISFNPDDQTFSVSFDDAYPD